MAYDDIIVGSGLSGLATALGLPRGRKVLVLTEGETLQPKFYNSTRSIPCAARGFGGLGNFWHGVVPLGATAAFARGRESDFEALFNWFYPHVDLQGRHGSKWLFIPRRPIRPQISWAKVVEDRLGDLELAPLTATRLEIAGGRVSVETADGSFSARRLWVCAGALDTPALLLRSFDLGSGIRRTASDHVIAYLGQVDRRTSPMAPPISVERGPFGYWLQALAESTENCIVTAKPARFSYRTLDRGIEQRSAFGLPVGGAIAKIARAGSLGLISEALFNKFGVFGGASMQSIYGQIHVPDAYALDVETGQLSGQDHVIQSHLQASRQSLQMEGLRPSRRPELYIPGIHLHNTLDMRRLNETGLTGLGSPMRIQDASAIEDIGGEHHSFHMMVAAYSAARQI